MFDGEDQGPHRDALLIGTSLVLEVLGMAKDVKDGVEMAASGIDSGAAKKLLGDLKAQFGAA